MLETLSYAAVKNSWQEDNSDLFSNCVYSHINLLYAAASVVRVWS